MNLPTLFTRCLLIGFWSIPLLLGAQNYPKDYFRSPLDIPLKLSGTFGELRTNHFHSGLDIRTNSMEGLKVYAAAEGHVSRIKVSAYGYGNAVYIDHPNGYTTVYAHLRDFEEPIRSWVEQKHYEKQNFELDIPLYPNELPVSKGQVVAFSGNTGGSGGPHLHFEVRDTKTEAVINPKHFGFSIPDNIAPVIDYLEVVPYGRDARINGSSNKKRFTAVRAANGQYSIAQRLETAGACYVQVRAWDKHNGNEFRNGVYKLVLRSGTDTLYQFTADRFEFNETRYANAVMDYQARMIHREQIYRGFQLPGNLLAMVQQPQAGAKVELKAGENRNYLLTVYDFDGNQTSLQFTLHGALHSTAEIAAPSSILKRYPPNEAWSWITEDVQLNMPANNLYDTLDFEYTRSAKPYAMFSAVHSLAKAEVPVHGFYDLAVRHNGLADSLKSKTVLVNININKGRSALLGKWEGDWFKAKARGLGDFYLAIDTIAPSINAVSLRPGGSYTQGQQIRFTLRDNLAGLGSYHLYLDDQWQKTVFDGKTASLSYTIHENSPKGNLNLRLVVKDAVGNTTTYTNKIYIP
jgi:hypothetical protein